MRVSAGIVQIHFEDFRMFTEAFGMQLDDDSLLALYHVYDPVGRWGSTPYEHHKCRFKIMEVCIHCVAKAARNRDSCQLWRANACVAATAVDGCNASAP